MASDVMTVRLHLRQIRVLGVLEDTTGALVVEVESTLRRLRCPHCGFEETRDLLRASHAELSGSLADARDRLIGHDAPDRGPCETSR